MTRDEYNAKVQELQAMWGDACKVNGHYYKEKLERSTFCVFWDGWWHVLGVEDHPFTPEASYQWSDALELRLRGEFASALMHS
jgi:hypothetical protein